MLILCLVGLLSLPAELLCNSRPLLVRWEGSWFFPALRRYTEQDFGGVRDLEPDYHGLRFRQLVGLVYEEDVRIPTLAELEKIFGDFDIAIDPDEELREAEDHVINADQAISRRPDPPWILWPPVPYDYAYINMAGDTGRTVLAAPWQHRIPPRTGELIPSSWNDRHYLGTDDRGRDVLARLIYGFRVSLIFGLLLALVGTFIGSIIGAIQGFFGGWVDLLGQRAVEVWGSLPQLYLLMILGSILTRSITVLFFILVLTSWMSISVYMRVEFLRGRSLDYVKAARSLGVSNRAIMFRHILPNSLTPIITFLPFSIAGGVLALVSLDFLGLGVPSPYPSLGELLAQGHRNIHAAWIIVPTFFVLSGMITLLTFIGDGFRNAFDPRMSRQEK